MSDYETSSDSDESYDAFNEFANGNPRRIIDWIRMGKVHIDAQDEDHGESLLIWASRHRVTDLVMFLVRRGCDINRIAHSDGQTALDIYSNDEDMTDYLRAHGAKTSEELWKEDEERFVDDPESDK
jgi:ankyrin repeat protein